MTKTCDKVKLHPNACDLMLRFFHRIRFIMAAVTRCRLGRSYWSLLSNLGNGRHTGYLTPLKRENCTNNGNRVARGRWSDKANGVGVGAAGWRRKGREPQGDDAVGGRKSDGGWKDSLCRETSVGPSRAIYFPRSLTAFALVGGQICNSPAHVIADLSAQWPTSPLFIYAEETCKRLHREGIWECTL